MHGSEKDINHLVLKKNITYVWMTSMWLSEIRKWVIGRHSTVIIANLHSYYLRGQLNFIPESRRVYHEFFTQDHHGAERTEEQPQHMNAFELISMSKGLNLGNLFDKDLVGTLLCRTLTLLNWSWTLVSTFLGLQFLKNSFLFLIFF